MTLFFLCKEEEDLLTDDDSFQAMDIDVTAGKWRPSCWRCRIFGGGCKRYNQKEGLHFPWHIWKTCKIGRWRIDGRLLLFWHNIFYQLYLPNFRKLSPDLPSLLSFWCTLYNQSLQSRFALAKGGKTDSTPFTNTRHHRFHNSYSRYLPAAFLLSVTKNDNDRYAIGGRCKFLGALCSIVHWRMICGKAFTYSELELHDRWVHNSDKEECMLLQRAGEEERPARGLEGPIGSPTRHDFIIARSTYGTSIYKWPSH